MTISTINIGNIVNDGLGDDLRTAFQKVNNNFSELNQRLLITGAQNVGASGAGVFKGKNADLLEFKKLVQGSNVTITNNTDTIVIDSPLQNAFTTVLVGADTIEALDTHPEFGIKAGTNVTVEKDGRYVKINAFGNPFRLSADPSPTLTGDLNLNGFNIQGPGQFNGNLTLKTTNGASTGTMFGNMEGLVYGIDIRDIAENPRSFDFGNISQLIETVFQFMMYTTPFDLGNKIYDIGADVEIESPFRLDFGSI
jgi:hypothetical protein